MMPFHKKEKYYLGKNWYTMCQSNIQKGQIWFKTSQVQGNKNIGFNLKKINTLTTVNVLQKYHDLANSDSNATQHNIQGLLILQSTLPHVI